MKGTTMKRMSKLAMLLVALLTVSMSAWSQTPTVTAGKNVTKISVKGSGEGAQETETTINSENQSVEAVAGSTVRVTGAQPQAGKVAKLKITKNLTSQDEIISGEEPVNVTPQITPTTPTKVKLPTVQDTDETNALKKQIRNAVNSDNFLEFLREEIDLPEDMNDFNELLTLKMVTYETCQTFVCAVQTPYIKDQEGVMVIGLPTGDDPEWFAVKGVANGGGEVEMTIAENIGKKLSNQIFVAIFVTKKVASTRGQEAEDVTEELDVTKVAGAVAEWTFTMRDYDVTAKVEYVDAVVSVSYTPEGGSETVAYYGTVEEAFAVAKNQDVITLLDDYNVPVDAEAGKSGIVGVADIYNQIHLTLDLNSHTLGFPNGGYLNVGTIVDLTVKGGTVSGTDYCIYSTGLLRLDGCTIKASTGTGISSNGELELQSLPVFDCQGADIALDKDKIIHFGEGPFAVPQKKIKVSIQNDTPYAFTYDFSRVFPGGEMLIDPSDVFTSSQYGDKVVGFIRGSKDYEAGIAEQTEITFPAGRSTYFDERGLALLEPNDDLKFYVVTGVSATSVEVTEVSSKTFNMNTPLIVSNSSGSAITAKMVVAPEGPMDNHFLTVFNNDLGEDASIYMGFEGTNEAIDNIEDQREGWSYYGFNGDDFELLGSLGPVSAHRCWLGIGVIPGMEEENEGTTLPPAGTHRLSISWPDGTTTAYGLNKGDGAEAHGKVAFKVGNNSATSATAGQTVTITVTPDAEYLVKDVTATVSGTNLEPAQMRTRGTSETQTTEIALNKGEGNTWTMVMPADNVTFSVAYEEFADITGVVVKGWSGVFDGKSHSVTVTGLNGATIKYQDAQGAYSLSEAPSFITTGTHTVYYQISKANHKPLTGKATIEIKSVINKDGTVVVNGKTYNSLSDAAKEILSSSNILGNDYLNNLVIGLLGDVTAQDVDDLLNRIVVTDEYKKMVITQGKNAILGILKVKAGDILKLVVSGQVKLDAKTILQMLGGAKARAFVRTRSEGGDSETEIVSGVEYLILEDCDIFLTLETEEGDVTIESITLGGKPGDANGDGYVDAADIVETENYKKGTPSQKFILKNVDTDNDTQISQEEIEAVVNIIMGKK